MDPNTQRTQMIKKESSEFKLFKHQPMHSYTDISDSFTPKATISFNHNGSVNIEGEDSEIYKQMSPVSKNEFAYLLANYRTAKKEF